MPDDLATYTAAALHYAAETGVPFPTAVERVLQVRDLMVAALAAPRPSTEDGRPKRLMPVR